MGRSSGGVPGIASSPIHSGPFSDLMKALTTFSRLIARCCFWPFEVLIVSRSEAASPLRSRSLSSSRIRFAALSTRKIHSEAVGRSDPVFELPEELLAADDLLRLELLEELPCVGEPLLRVF